MRHHRIARWIGDYWLIVTLSALAVAVVAVPMALMAQGR